MQARQAPSVLTSRRFDFQRVTAHCPDTHRRHTQQPRALHRLHRIQFRGGDDNAPIGLAKKQRIEAWLS